MRFNAARGSGGFVALLKGENLTPFDGEVSFVDPENAAKPFAPHYEQYIRPYVNEFELKRIQTLQLVRSRLLKVIHIGGAVLVLILGIMVAAPLSADSKQNIVFLGLTVAFFTAVWIYYPIMKYATEIKDKIFPNIFNFFSEDYVYNREGGLDIDALEASGIIPSHNRRNKEDYVKGSYKDVALELMEACLSHESGSGKNKRTVVKFKGIFILLSMNKNFSGKTIVLRDAGKIGNWFGKKFSSMENVTLEDPVFEKQFECYATDQVEARYMLTTSFMERLLELSRLFGDSGIQCSFYDNRLLLMIPSRQNRFEVSSVFLPATFINDINSILKEMHLIFQIIDILKLDQRTGL